MKEETFQMVMTQVWFIVFGISLGATIVEPWFWWMPVFILICLVITRKLIKHIDGKVKRYEEIQSKSDH